MLHKVCNKDCRKVTLGLIKLQFRFPLTAKNSVTITYNACTNMTTNEQLNWRRYDYLKNQMGQFSNPFNRGTKQNLKEFFHLQRSVEEVTNPESLMSV